jgi:hypothetical protein
MAFKRGLAWDSHGRHNAGCEVYYRVARGRKSATWTQAVGTGGALEMASDPAYLSTESKDNSLKWYLKNIYKQCF